jgi:hypothetical protein
VLPPLWSPLLLDVKPTEVEFGGRLEDVDCLSRELDELSQCQPREFEELDERLQGCCWTAGCAPGVTTPCCAAGSCAADCGRQSLRGSI